MRCSEKTGELQTQSFFPSELLFQQQYSSELSSELVSELEGFGVNLRSR